MNDLAITEDGIYPATQSDLRRELVRMERTYRCMGSGVQMATD